MDSRLRTLLVLLVLPLAGCAQQADPPGAPSPAEPVVVTDVDDVESLSNETLAARSHLHDYWKGGDHLVVMDETRRGRTFFVSGSWALAFEPESGRVVPQGTSWLDVTFSWTNAQTDTYSRPELWVRTPADHEAWKVGPVEKGAPVRVETTAAHADVPHQALSAWRFELRVYPGTGSGTGLIWFEGEVDILVEAHRGLEIPLYPPHPDAWQGREQISLLDESRPFGMYWGRTTTGEVDCLGQCPYVHRPVDGVIVPWDAALFEVRLKPSGESLSTLGLAFHGADRREWTNLEPDAKEGGVLVYRIPVAQGMGDGPYASQSQWGFLTTIEGPLEDGLHAAGYAIEAVALRQS